MSDRHKMFAPVEIPGGGELLRGWTWLIPPPVDVLRVTACGDVFYADTTGAVWFLDTAHATTEKVANRRLDLDRLFDDMGNRRQYLLSYVVRLLYTSGKELGSNQCYSPKHPIVLGGKIDSDNYEVTDVRVHLDVTGQLHSQVKSLPPGTQIDDVRIEGTD